MKVSLANDFLKPERPNVRQFNVSENPIAKRSDQGKKAFIRRCLRQHQGRLRSQRFDRAFNHVEVRSFDIDLDSSNAQVSLGHKLVDCCYVNFVAFFAELGRWAGKVRYFTVRLQYERRLPEALAYSDAVYVSIRMGRKVQPQNSQSSRIRLEGMNGPGFGEHVERVIANVRAHIQNNTGSIQVTGEKFFAAPIDIRPGDEYFRSKFTCPRQSHAQTRGQNKGVVFAEDTLRKLTHKGPSQPGEGADLLDKFQVDWHDHF